MATDDCLFRVDRRFHAHNAAPCPRSQCATGPKLELRARHQKRPPVQRGDLPQTGDGAESHLGGYCNEFSYRFNRREEQLQMFDATLKGSLNE